MEIGLVLGIASLIATAIIGGLSFYLTHKTSTKATRETVDMSKTMATTQIRSSATGKLAEFRMQWINDFRIDLADLIRCYSEIFSIQRRYKDDIDTFPDIKSQLDARKLETVVLRSRLLLRLKPNSDDENERELEKLLLKIIESDDLTEANSHRKKILSRSRSLLKREWERVKAEMNEI